MAFKLLMSIPLVKEKLVQHDNMNKSITYKDYYTTYTVLCIYSIHSISPYLTVDLRMWVLFHWSNLHFRLQKFPMNWKYALFSQQNISNEKDKNGVPFDFPQTLMQILSFVGCSGRLGTIVNDKHKVATLIWSDAAVLGQGNLLFFFL